MTRAPVQEFLCAVRRKLWLQATLERLRLGVWAGSLVFLAAAAVNLLGVEITPAIAVFVGLSTALAVTLTALARRPRLAACALHADRIFQTRELMVTALELTTATTTPGTPAAIVVRNRACVAAQQLERRVGSVWRAPRPGGFVLVAVPVFVALLLFALSDGAPATSGDTGNTLTGLNLIGQSGLDSDVGLRELQQSIVSAATPRGERRNAESAPVQDITPTSRDPATGEPLHATNITETPVGTPRLSTGNPDGGREAGRAHRTTTLSGNRDLTGSTPGQRATVWLQRRGEATSGSGEGDRDFEAGVAASPAGGPVVKAAAAPPALSAWTALTPAEAAFARRYLGGRETDNE